MALTRKFLSALGIEQDKVDEIISAHAETVDGLKGEISALKTEADKVPGLTKELEDLRKAAENGGDGFEQKFNDLKAEYDGYKAEVAAADAKRAKEAAVRAMLKEQSISDKGIEKILKYDDLSKIELDESGKIKGAEELAKSFKEEWSEYVVTTNPQGAKTSTPPAGNGSGGTMTKEQIMAIKDTNARQAAMLENAGLFGFSTEEN